MRVCVALRYVLGINQAVRGAAGITLNVCSEVCDAGHSFMTGIFNTRGWAHIGADAL